MNNKYKELYNYLLGNNMTSLDENSFYNEYSQNDEKFSKLYSYLQTNKMTSLDPETFKLEYFGTPIIKKKSQVESTESGLEDGSLEPSSTTTTGQLEPSIYILPNNPGALYRKKGDSWLKKIGENYIPLSKGDVRARERILDKQAVLASDFQADWYSNQPKEIPESEYATQEQVNKAYPDLPKERWKGATVTPIDQTIPTEKTRAFEQEEAKDSILPEEKIEPATYKEKLYMLQEGKDNENFYKNPVTEETYLYWLDNNGKPREGLDPIKSQEAVDLAANIIGESQMNQLSKINKIDKIDLNKRDVDKFLKKELYGSNFGFNQEGNELTINSYFPGMNGDDEGLENSITIDLSKSNSSSIAKEFLRYNLFTKREKEGLENIKDTESYIDAMINSNGKIKMTSDRVDVISEWARTEAMAVENDIKRNEVDVIDKDIKSYEEKTKLFKKRVASGNMTQEEFDKENDDLSKLYKDISIKQKRAQELSKRAQKLISAEELIQTKGTPEEKGSTVGALVKSFTSGMSNLALTGLDYSLAAGNLIMGDEKFSKLIDGNYGAKKVKGLTDAQIANAAQATVKDFAKEKYDLGWENITGTNKEYIRSENRGMIPQALNAVAESFGTAATGGALGKVGSTAAFFSMSYNAMEDQMRGPDFDHLNENEKKLISVPYGLVIGQMEKWGFDVAVGAGKNPLFNKFANYIVTKTFKNLPKNAGLIELNSAIQKNIGASIAKGLIKIAGGGVSEGNVEFMQQEFEGIQKFAVNEILKNDNFNEEYFKDAEDLTKAGGWSALLGQGWDAFKLGALAGGMTSAGASVKNNIVNILSNNKFDIYKSLVLNTESRNGWIASIKEDQKNGKISPEEMNKQIDELNKSYSVLTKIPASLTTQSQREAFSLIQEREIIQNEIKDKDPNLVVKETNRIKEINESLKTTSENATKENNIKQQEGTAEGGISEYQGTGEGQQKDGVSEGGQREATVNEADSGDSTVASKVQQEEQVAAYREQEQAELLKAIPKIEKYKVDGKIDKTLMPKTVLAKYNSIYNKYDKLISPLLETTGEVAIDKPVITTNTTAEVERVKSLSFEAEDGATFNIDGTKYEGVGLVVAVDSMNTTTEELTPEMVADFVAERQKMIGDAGVVKAGIYKFPNSNQVSIDLSVVVPETSREQALEFARLAGQESLFDLATFENIKTGATGENPMKFTPEQHREISKALKEGRMPNVFGATTETTNNLLTKENVREFASKQKTTAHKLIVKAAKMVLNAIPGIKIYIHNNGQEMVSAVDSLKKQSSKQQLTKEEKTGIAESSGIYVDGAIHIDLESATIKTVYHEAFHALTEKMGMSSEATLLMAKGLKNIISNKDLKQELENFISQYETVKEKFKEEIEKENKKRIASGKAAMNEKETDEYVVYLNDLLKSDEFLAELTGILSEAEQELTTTKLQQFKTLINNIAKKLGLPVIFSASATAQDAADFINTMSKKLRTGKEIDINDPGDGGEVGTFNIPKVKFRKAKSVSEDSRDFIRKFVEDLDIRELNGEKFITNMYDFTNAGKTDLGNGFEINMLGGKNYVPLMMSLNNKKIGEVSNLAAFNTKAQAETFVRNAEMSGAKIFAPHSGTLSNSWQFQQHTFAELSSLVLDNEILTKDKLIDVFNDAIKTNKSNQKEFNQFAEKYGENIKNFDSFKSDPKKIIELLDIKNNYSPNLRKALNNAISANKEFQKAIGIKNKQEFYNRIMDPLNQGMTGGEIMNIVKFDPNTFEIVQTKESDIDNHPSFGWTLLAKINGIYQPTELYKSSDITETYTKYNKGGEEVSRKSEEPKFEQKNVSSSAGAIPKVAEFKETPSKIKFQKSSGVGYRSGDLINKAETKGKFEGGNRSTGHFGTGFYFFGTKKKADEYSNRETSSIDLSGYNLANGTIKLHDLLKDVNTYAIGTQKENDSLKYSIENIIRYFNKNISINNIKDLNDQNNNIKSIVDKINNSTIDSPSTVVMKALGFDGVDSRGTELDNAQYGSVIYSLKKSEEGAPSKIKKQLTQNWVATPVKSMMNSPIAKNSDNLRSVAIDLAKGKINQGEYADAVKKYSPIGSIGTLFAPSTLSHMITALGKKAGKLMAPVVDELGKKIKRVGLRLDIPSYLHNNAWIVTVHDGRVKNGNVISYRNAARLKNVEFTTDPKVALNIAAGFNSKGTFARMEGEMVDIPGETAEEQGLNAQAMIEEIMNDPSWVQVGMNPFRHSFFWNRANGAPVISADEVIQVGGLVYAKNAIEASPNSDRFTVYGKYDEATNKVVKSDEPLLDKSGSKIKFQKTTTKQEAIQKAKDKYELSVEKRGNSHQQGVTASLGDLQKSDWYVNADDTAREDAVREIKAFFGEKLKKAPSVSKILGKPKPETQTKTVNALRKEFFTAWNKSAREAKGDLNQKRKMLAATIKGLVKLGRLTVKQAATIINRVSVVNLDNQVMVGRLADYAAKVFEKADYQERLSRAFSFRKGIRKLLKGDIQAEVVGMAKKFSKIDPSMVDDIEKYLEMAEIVKNAIKPSRVNRKDLDVNMRESMNIDSVSEFTNDAIENQERILKEELLAVHNELVDAGVIDDKMSLSDIESIINSLKEEADNADYEADILTFLSKRIDTMSAIIKDMLIFKINPMTGEEVALTEKNIDVISRMLNIDINNVSIKEAIFIAEAMDNFINNNITSSVEAVIEKKEGETELENLIDDKVVASPLRKYFSPYLGQFMSEQVASMPILFEKLFVGAKKGLMVAKKMGWTALINGVNKAEKMFNTTVDVYFKQYSKTKPNGKSFNDAENVYERGMLAFLSRNVSGTVTQQAEELKRRVEVLKESVKSLLEGSSKEQKMGEIYQKVYDKLNVESGDIDIIHANADKINRSAVGWWINQWGTTYSDLSDISLSVYNTMLSSDTSYSTDRYKLLDKANLEEIIEPKNIGAFGRDIEFLDKNKTGVLMESNRPSASKVSKANRYISLDFDVNNSSAYKAALIDVNTAAAIRRIDGFINSKNFNKLIPTKEDRDIFRKRIAEYIQAAKNKRVEQSDKMRLLDQLTNFLGGIGVSKALGGIDQVVKQTLPIALSTFVNSGRFDLVMPGSSASIWIDSLGMAISNRGQESQSTIESVDRRLEKASGIIDKSTNAFVDVQQFWLKYFLSKPDVFIAKSSFISYYKQYLSNNNQSTDIDWATHNVNQDAADYAMTMVDRQQNISDTKMAGKIFSSQNSSIKIMRKIFLPFASFSLNQKSRMVSDIKVLGMNSGASKQDRKIAIRSLASLPFEMALYQSMSLAIRLGYLAIAKGIIGAVADDDDEEKERLLGIEISKELKNATKYPLRSMITDFFSPAPILDHLVVGGANALLSQLEDKEMINDAVDKKNMMLEVLGKDKMDEDQKEKFIKKFKKDHEYQLFNDEKKSYGTIGIGTDLYYEVIDNAKTAYTGKYTQDYMGNESERYLLPKDRENIQNAVIFETLFALGILPRDVNTVTKNIIKLSKKNSLTETQYEKYKAIGKETGGKVTGWKMDLAKSKSKTESTLEELEWIKEYGGLTEKQGQEYVKLSKLVDEVSYMQLMDLQSGKTADKIIKSY
jgi:hypothetical protein